MLLWLARILCFIPLNILHPTTIKGRKNLTKGKAILACNHRSNWDITMYYLNTSKRLKILAKKQMFKNKFFGAIMRALGGISVDREGNDVNAIKNCMKALKEDKKLFIFPEGTRHHEKGVVLGELKSGMAMIAIKTKTPIVPIWVGKHKLFRRSKYYIGKPFELNQFYGAKLDEETLNKANEVVREKMLEVRQIELDRRNAKKNKKKKK